VDPASLTGDINIAGSSTVYPLSEAVAENFNKDGFTGNVNIASVGTGGGFERFCKTGETDIANASRAIKDSEMEACAALNPARVPLEFRVGTDAIAVVVSKENTFAKDITLEELGLLFTSAEKWSDVRADWPAEPIQRFTPGTDSGTFDFFVEVVIQKPQKIEKLDDAKKLALDATNIQTSEDDNVLVQGVEGSPYAIGYFGFAYYKQQESRLIALSVDGIAPSFETAESGEYVLARPLFIYSDANVLKQKPQVAGFINYFLTYVNEWIDDVGYFPASEEALNTARQLFLDAVK
jgi:phosphate transport system substrate-binding protein